MKTLVELLHDEMVRNGYFGANGRDDEALAGIVGAVQEWLGQDEIRPIMYREASYDLAWQIQERLQREAGKGDQR